MVLNFILNGYQDLQKSYMIFSIFIGVWVYDPLYWSCALKDTWHPGVQICMFVQDLSLLCTNLSNKAHMFYFENATKGCVTLSLGCWTLKINWQHVYISWYRSKCSISWILATFEQNCWNPNSTNNSIELNLRLDYILTARSTTTHHHPPPPPHKLSVVVVLPGASLTSAWHHDGRACVVRVRAYPS